jgi:hypothetical protein
MRSGLVKSWSFECSHPSPLGDLRSCRPACLRASLTQDPRYLMAGLKARTFTHTVAHLLPGPPTLNLYLRPRILIPRRPFAFIVFSPDSGAHCDPRCPTDVRNPIEKHSTRPLTFLPLTHHTLFWYAFPFFSSVSAAACSSSRP